MHRIHEKSQLWEVAKNQSENSNQSISQGNNLDKPYRHCNCFNPHLSH